jgi:hypothetical protein
MHTSAPPTIRHCALFASISDLKKKIADEKKHVFSVPLGQHSNGKQHRQRRRLRLLILLTSL